MVFSKMLFLLDFKVRFFLVAIIIIITLMGAFP